jgi:hypothetical protein
VTIHAPEDYGIEVKPLTDPVSGQPWNVLIVMPGAAPFTNQHRRNNGREAIVEFYDARQDPERFTPLGQYASSYYIGSLVEGLSEGRGLNLHGGTPSWSVSRFVVEAAVKHCIDVLHVHVGA